MNEASDGVAGQDMAARSSGQIRGALLGGSIADSDPRQKCSAYYDQRNRDLNETEYRDSATFLNYGYVQDDDRDCGVVALPRRCLNKNSLKLVIELVADVKLLNSRVLDVGCGRGGTIIALKRWYGASRLVGVDASAEAIRFCANAHASSGALFLQADAQSLPILAGSFDCVTNIESSQHYLDIKCFYSEVHRVLTAKGHLLYTDVMPKSMRLGCMEALVSIGFEFIRVRDVTRNVLLSCDEIAESRVRAFGDSDVDGNIAEFVAAPGSVVYEKMSSGDWAYEMWTLRKIG